MSAPSLTDILKLDLEERLEMVQAIWDSIAAAPERVPVTEAERAELDRRIDDHAEHPNDVAAWDDLKARLLPPK